MDGILEGNVQILERLCDSWYWRGLEDCRSNVSHYRHSRMRKENSRASRLLDPVSGN
jgi:hypothetical protein